MAFTREQLIKLKEAYASGVLRIRLGEQEVMYKTEAEMRKTIERMEAELFARKKPRYVTLTFTKGL